MSQAFLGTLMKNKTRAVAGLFVFAMLLSVAMPTGVSARAQSKRRTNRNRQVTKSEVRESLAGTQGVLEGSDQVRAMQDSDSAATAQIGGTLVDVPKDAKRGVIFGAAEGTKLDIELPNANQAGEGSQVAPGVVAYDANNGSSNAVQATEDGSVRMMTVIDNPDAPTAYDYKITVPQGGSVQLSLSGGAVILNSEGLLLSVVDAPWAKDANSKAVETWFSTDGQTLTQHVKHNIPGLAYPVTADPRVSWSWHGVTIYLSRGETNAAAWVPGAIGAYFGWTGIGGAAVYAIPGAAAWATRHGYCLAVYKAHWQYYPSLWAYRC